MYQFLLELHSLFRWFVIISLLYTTFRSFRGFFSNATFSKTEDRFRHWTATIAHVQLMLGIYLYTQSPIVRYFWNNFSDAIHNTDQLFFGLIHIVLMLSGITIITIGSALAKRKKTAKEKFKTMMIWFTISILIIFIAIPWPFSPLASRPYL